MTAPFTIAHLFCGGGGGGLGMKRAGFRCVGAFDSDPTACASFEKLVGFKPTCVDLSKCTPNDIAAGCSERPHAVFLSAPCKGMSGCLSLGVAQTPIYQEMNSLTMLGVYLVLEAWPVPPPLIVFENVPRIKSRGKVWLDRIVAMLQKFGYAVTLSSHDCGEIGGLAQHRRRFLLVARHIEHLGEYLRVPELKPLLTIGDVLGAIPQPVPARAARGAAWPGGPMHTLPALSAMNWLRLACIPAGNDFHALPPAVRQVEGIVSPRLPVREARQNGGFGVERWDDASHAVLAHHCTRDTWGSVSDPRLAPIEHRHDGAVGVERWDGQAHTVTGQHGRRNWDSVSDPRINTERYPASLGVRDWDGHANTIRGTGRIQTEALSVADPRIDYDARRGTLEVQPWDEAAKTVRADMHVRNDSAAAVSDPRMRDEGRYHGSYGVQDWAEPSKTIRSHMNLVNSPSAIADPRLRCEPRTGAYGVESWARPSHTIVGHATHDNSPASVADPRDVIAGHVVLAAELGRDRSPWPQIDLVGPRLDLTSKRGTYVVIRSLAGCWSRPFTTLELAALQGLPVFENGTWLELAGTSHGSWREQIGNMVPPPAAEAIGKQMIAALTAARDGAFVLSNSDIWVREIGGPALEITAST